MPELVIVPIEPGIYNILCWNTKRVVATICMSHYKWVVTTPEPKSTVERPNDSEGGTDGS